MAEHNIVDPADDPAPGPAPSTTEDYPGRVDFFATATSDGTWQTSFDVPADTPPGGYAVGVVCYGGEGVAGKVGYATPVLAVEQRAETPAPASPARQNELPATGSRDLLPIALAGFMMVAFGYLCRVPGRRR